MHTTSNSSTQPESAPVSEPGGKDENTTNGSIKPFSFPFSPEAFSPAQRNDKPWHQQGNKSNHDQRPGASPKGSRRSMGKR